ncbi:thioredoxin-dependent thiol peroxidase [Paenibacillus wynnii]|uniref:thioredoxin-dependent thiol peroxidase n=1 Tax=Paenibacillus wynnii TaxID=268407 RepID=UPI002794850B|nr:thioredoxin-dependent thiol peroxidase [Paenibacillus wynnii]MDQ0196689.1 peroxiredoxin Q/BCP [Paenibacillus wynnii]
MNTITIGDTVPDFTLPASDGNQVSLSQYRGQKIILYFYPKDMTPACTQEACEFRDVHDQITIKGAVILGISPDRLESHTKFIAKNELPFLLLSDEDHKVSEMFGVWQLKKLYGKEFMGIVRSTFLIDEEGVLKQEWRKVRVKGHVEAAVELLDLK